MELHCFSDFRKQVSCCNNNHAFICHIGQIALCLLCFVDLHWFDMKIMRREICRMVSLNNIVFMFCGIVFSWKFRSDFPCSFVISSCSSLLFAILSFDILQILSQFAMAMSWWFRALSYASLLQRIKR